MVEKHIAPAVLPRKYSAYGMGTGGEEVDVESPVGTYPDLNRAVYGVGLDLDGSDESVLWIDAELVAGRLVVEPKVLWDIAMYLGDIVCAGSAHWRWVRDSAGYLRVRCSETELWDVVEFVHRRSVQAVSVTLLDAVVEMGERSVSGDKAEALRT